MSQEGPRRRKPEARITPARRGPPPAERACQTCGPGTCSGPCTGESAPVVASKASNASALWLTYGLVGDLFALVPELLASV
jgi:hypothetical protein